MSEIVELNAVISFCIDIWNSRNRILWDTGIVIVILWLILRKLRFIQKNKYGRRVTKLLPIIGVVFILLCFATGAGSGLGIGNGDGLSVGNGEDTEQGDSISEEESPETLAEAAEQVVSSGKMRILVSENDIYVSGWLCRSNEEVEKAIDSIYADDTVVEVVDNYAYYEPYEEVIRILDEKAIDYQELSDGGN